MRRLHPLPARFWLFTLLFFISTTTALSQTVTGKIVDEAGQPMSGVSVTEKGTTKGATSKQDGSYTLTVTNPKAVLVFSFVGYATKEIPADNAAAAPIVLAAD